MSIKKIYSIIPLMGLIVAGAANGATIYDNSISALNVNMLSQNLMSYTHLGENMSDLFENKIVYGTMTRFDEYGDDGSTLRPKQITGQSDELLFKNVWANAQHINTHAHYAADVSQHPRFNLFTVGTQTRDIDLIYGNIYFGGFIGYITGDIAGADSNGNAMGLFAHYKYRDFDITALIDNGSINNDSNLNEFNNAWFNVGADVSWKFRIDDTLYFQPMVYAGYTWVSSDNLYLNGDNISSKNFMIFNVAPGARFVKNIIGDWYGALSAKYMATFNDDNDIYVNGVRNNGASLDDYTDIGLDIEYDYQKFVFTGAVHKQIGGFDGWIGNINIKYMF